MNCSKVAGTCPIKDNPWRWTAWADKHFRDNFCWLLRIISATPVVALAIGVFPFLFTTSTWAPASTKDVITECKVKKSPTTLEKKNQIRSDAKKESKFLQKYLVKSCLIWFKLWHFLNKEHGKNIWKFQQNRTFFC